jgi:hypothetical protein
MKSPRTNKIPIDWVYIRAGSKIDKEETHDKTFKQELKETGLLRFWSESERGKDLFLVK